MKLPPQAKKVFQGTIFAVYQWEQELYDGTTATFEMIKRPGTVQVLPIVGDKILLASEEQPHYAKRLGFLGGRMEEGEDPLETAKRELLEETGYESSDWELIREVVTPGKIDWSINYYVARNCHKVSEPHLDPGERIDIKEVTFSELLDIVLSPGFIEKELVSELASPQKDSKKIEDFKKLLGI